MKMVFSLFLCALAVCLSFIPASAAKADIEAYYALTKPVIDGVVDEIWADVPAINADYGDEMREITGYGKFLWDENYLYVLVVVEDDTPNTESIPSAESVDIFMDEMNTENDGYTDIGEWGLTITRQGISYVTYVDGEFYSDREDLNANVETAVVDNGKSYVIEAKIAFRSPNMEAAAGHTMGINCAFNNDIDDDGIRDEFGSFTSAENPYWSDAGFLSKLGFSETAVSGASPIEEAPADTVAETEAEVVVAPSTADAGIIPAVAVAIVAAGFVLKKKR